MARLVGGFGRWVFDLEGEPLRQVCARREDPETYLKLSRQRDARVRWRGMVAVPVLALVIAVAVLLAVAKPGVRWLAVAALVAGLGLAGRRADKPLLDTAVMVPKVAKLTSDVVVRALSALGLAGINQALGRNPDAIGFAAPITRDGPGWRADVDLPYGVTATEVIERRDKLASGLGRPLGCVWPEGDHGGVPVPVDAVGGRSGHGHRQAGGVAAGQVRAGGPVQGVPVRHRPARAAGHDGADRDERADRVAARRGQDRRAAGDRAGRRAGPARGAVDLRAEGLRRPAALEKVSARYASGHDDEAIEAALVALRDLRKECARRAKLIKALPREHLPGEQGHPATGGAEESRPASPGLLGR